MFKRNRYQTTSRQRRVPTGQQIQMVQNHMQAKRIAAPIPALVEPATATNQAPGLAIVPEAITNDNPIAQVAGVYPTAPEFGLRRLPPELTFELDNSASAVDTNFLIFDSYGFVENSLAPTVVVAPTGSSSSVAGIKASTEANPILFRGLSIKTSTDAAQFSQRFQVMRGDLDGAFMQVPTILAAAERNTQFNDLLQTYSNSFVIDGYSAVFYVVLAGELVDLTFFNGTIYNRLS